MFFVVCFRIKHLQLALVSNRSSRSIRLSSLEDEPFFGEFSSQLWKRRVISSHLTTRDIIYMAARRALTRSSGRLQSETVNGTALELVSIGSRISQADLRLLYGSGYKHNRVLNNPGQTSSPAAVVCDRVSGRVMEVLTTEPGLPFFSRIFRTANAA